VQGALGEEDWATGKSTGSEVVFLEGTAGTRKGGPGIRECRGPWG
jgi:hypothetical protein